MQLRTEEHYWNMLWLLLHGMRFVNGINLCLQQLPRSSTAAELTAQATIFENWTCDILFLCQRYSGTSCNSFEKSNSPIQTCVAALCINKYRNV
jgi:hypothetical protein